MARNPVNPVRPVDAVVSARPVDSGATYYRHLELWRITSEVNAAARRAKLPGAWDPDFARVLAEAEKPRT